MLFLLVLLLLLDGSSAEFSFFGLFKKATPDPGKVAKVKAAIVGQETTSKAKTNNEKPRNAKTNAGGPKKAEERDEKAVVEDTSRDSKTSLISNFLRFIRPSNLLAVDTRNYCTKGPEKSTPCEACMYKGIVHDLSLKFVKGAPPLNKLKRNFKYTVYVHNMQNMSTSFFIPGREKTYVGFLSLDKVKPRAAEGKCGYFEMGLMENAGFSLPDYDPSVLDIAAAAAMSAANKTTIMSGDLPLNSGIHYTVDLSIDPNEGKVNVELTLSIRSFGTLKCIFEIDPEDGTIDLDSLRIHPHNKDGSPFKVKPRITPTVYCNKK